MKNNRGTEQIKELNIISDQRNEFEIPSGIKRAYLLFSNGSNINQSTAQISGDIIVSGQNEPITTSSYVDVHKHYLRSTLQIFDLELTGENGKINVNSIDGSDDYCAWTAIVIY